MLLWLAFVFPLSAAMPAENSLAQACGVAALPTSAEPRVLELGKYLNVEEDVQAQAPIEAAGRKPRELGRRGRRNLDKVIVESTNLTGWSAIFERLEKTKADVVCVQEHRTPPDLIDERSAQMRKLGWKSFWAPAIVTATEGEVDARSTSGGVAIFARRHVGLTPVFEGRGCELAPGRLVACKVTVPGSGPIVVYSAYYQCGAGWSQPSIDLSKVMAERIREHNLPWITAADWNMEPEEINNAGLDTALKAKIKAPTNAGTCISPGCTRVIDYFLVDSKLALGVVDIDTILDANTRPHRPVQLHLLANLKSATKTVFKRTAPLPTEQVTGPMREPPSATAAKALVEKAIGCFKEDRVEEGFDVYNEAFGIWAEKAEEMVAGANDLPRPLNSSRARKPVATTTPLVPGLTKNGEIGSKAAASSNLLQRLQELTALAKKAWRVEGDTWSRLRVSATRTVDRCAEVKSKVDESLRLKVVDISVAFKGLAEEAIGRPNAEFAAAYWGRYTECLCTAAAIREELSKVTEKEKSYAKAAKDKAWKGWRERELEGSAGRAHKFSKLPQPWAPPEVSGPDGARVHDAKGLLEVESGRYSELWAAKAPTAGRTSAGNEPCARLLPAQLRRIARSFKKRTGVAPDGWHPRHFAMLSDELLEVLSSLYEVRGLGDDEPPAAAAEPGVHFPPGQGLRWHPPHRPLHRLLPCLVKGEASHRCQMDC